MQAGDTRDIEDAQNLFLVGRLTEAQQLARSLVPVPHVCQVAAARQCPCVSPVFVILQSLDGLDQGPTCLAVLDDVYGCADRAPVPVLSLALSILHRAGRLADAAPLLDRTSHQTDLDSFRQLLAEATKERLASTHRNLTAAAAAVTAPAAAAVSTQAASGAAAGGASEQAVRPGQPSRSSVTPVPGSVTIDASRLPPWRVRSSVSLVLGLVCLGMLLLRRFGWPPGVARLVRWLASHVRAFARLAGLDTFADGRLWLL